MVAADPSCGNPELRTWRARHRRRTTPHGALRVLPGGYGLSTTSRANVIHASSGGL